MSDVIEIDPSSGRVVGKTVPLRGAAAGLDVGEGSVWAVTVQGLLLRIDPHSQRTLSTFRIPHGASDLAVGLGAAWLTNPDDGTVSRVDPVAGRVTETTHVPYEPWRVAVGGGGVWVQTRNLKAPLYRLDPMTGRVTNEVDAQLAAVSAHAVWVTGSFGLRRIDPTTVVVEGPTLGFNNQHVWVGVAGTQLWVGEYFFNCHPNTEGPTTGSFALFRVDPATLRALSGPVFVGVGPNPFAHPVFSEGSFWIEPEYGRPILRIDLRKAAEVSPTPTPGLLFCRSVGVIGKPDSLGKIS